MFFEKLNWGDFKTNAASQGLILHYIEKSDYYKVYTNDGLVSIECLIPKDAGADQIDFENNYKGNVVYRPSLSRDLSIPVVATRKEERDYSTIVSHNFCDNTTWTLGQSDSSWHIEPSAGDIIILSRSEIQFKHDLDLTNNKVKLDYYAWIGGGAEAVVQTIEFNTLENIFELGNAHFESSLMGGLTTVQFNQEYQLVLYGSDNPGKLKRIHVYSDSHSEVTGSYVTASFVTETRDAP